MISFVCPTKDRPERHAHLWRQYAQQKIWPKELIVGDDGRSQSGFFQRLRDPTVRYIYFTDSLPLGDKRNRLNAIAHGDVIVHLDDDDHYAPDYTRHMLQHLRGHNLARLSKFRVLDERDGALYMCDTLRPTTVGKLVGSKWNGIRIPTWFSRQNAALRWGYGFSYVYQKTLWAQVLFSKSMTLREDVDFVKRALREGALIRQVNNGAHLATHVVHDGSTSTAFTTARLNPHVMHALARTAIGYSVGGGLFGFAVGHAIDRTLLR
jgi:Glycosyl transferase family 2